MKNETKLKNFIRIFSLLIIICFSIISFNCDFKKPVAPQWDVQLNLPLVNRPYSIDSLINKNPELFQINAQNGLVSYSYSQRIISDSVGEKLNIKPEQPNPLSIDAGSIPYRDFKLITYVHNPGIPSGIIPPGNLPPFSVTLPSTDQFDYLEFDSGRVKLNMFNYSPITIEFTSPITFIDGENNTFIFDIGTIAPFTQKSSEISLENKRLTMPLKLDTAYARTPGSSGVVTMPDSILKVELNFSTLKINSARAKIPPTEIFRINNSKLVIDTSAYPSKLKIARFKKGALSLKIINDFDVAAEVRFQLPQFLNRITRQNFDLNRIIARKDSFQININLPDYEFNSPYPTDTVYFNASIRQLGSEDDTTAFRIFKATDKLIARIIISPPPDNEFVLSYVEGIIKPTVIDFDTTLNIKLGELPDKFKFDSLKLPDSRFNFVLSCPNIPLRFAGNILLADSAIYRISIPQTTLNANTSTTVQISGNELVSSLTNYILRNKNLPESYNVNTNFLINPDYTSGSISSSDKVNGNVILDLPLNVGIKKGFFRDTLLVGDEKDDNGNKVDIDSTFLDRVQNGAVNFNLNNRIPIGLKLLIILLDKERRFIQYLPATGPVLVNPAQIGGDGFSTDAVQSKISINMNKNDIDNFNRAKYAVVELEINSLPSAPSVKIRNTDFIQVRVFSSFNYRFRNDD